MLGSVHLVDGGVRSGMRRLLRPPTITDTQGLRHAQAVIAAPLGKVPPAPQPSRFGLVAFWDDEAALDRFLDTPAAQGLDGGWSVRLDPLRAVPVATGHFPGIPDDLPASAGADSPGAVAVLTIGRLRLRRAPVFLRTSSRAERQVAGSPGILWASGLVNPAQRVVATISLWDSARHVRAYATSTTGHTAALAAESRRSFHHAGSFVRFHPRDARGHLPGRNPLAEDVTEVLNRGGARRGTAPVPEASA
jgi:heme-degrading monooxygenase HmoA